MKRLFDFFGALIGLMIFSPILLVFIFLVWIDDRKSPFYFAPRVTINGVIFRMVKLRSMVVGADKTGVASTSSGDLRITPVGVLIRKYKLDEITQLWNVLMGDMSLVGPRPNLERDVSFYTKDEKDLLKVRSGITDMASIVFSDEGDILKGKADPEIAYNQLIRPAKSRLGLLYVEKNSIVLDIHLCWLTLCTIFSRKYALLELQKILKKLEANEDLIKIASRQYPLTPMFPPGATSIVTSGDGNTVA
jgi:lipopolysaccharide/colanic/teichoic acid biosynthesis glycosyltransferase